MVILNEAYARATSEQEFYGKLKQRGLQIYFRGKQAGVVGKRKYRLKTLGFSLERLAALNREPNRRLKELDRIIDNRINKHNDKHNEQTL